MKTTRLLLAALAISVAAACVQSPTGPSANDTVAEMGSIAAGSGA